jgi:hypothetical protein
MVHTYSILYFTGSSVASWVLSKDQEWMPWYLGGHGAIENSFVDMPFYATDPGVMHFGYAVFGFHLEQLLSHLLAKKRGGDFAEMLLHDSVTCFLYFGYICSNLVPIGTIIIFLHDITDIPFHISKFANSTKNIAVAGVFFVVGQLGWIWFRLVALPLIIYSLYTQANYGAARSTFDIFIGLNSAFLSMLLLMHIFWFTMFQRINIKLFRGAWKAGENDQPSAQCQAAAVQGSDS